MAAAVSDDNATLSWLPNFAYSFMATRVRDAELEGRAPLDLRGVVNCSEPILASSHETFVERFAAVRRGEDRLAVSYALAENTFAATSGGFGGPPGAGERVVGVRGRGSCLDTETEIRRPRTATGPSSTKAARARSSCARPRS